MIQSYSGHRIRDRLADRGMTVGNLVGKSIGAGAFLLLHCVPLTVMDDFGHNNFPGAEAGRHTFRFKLELEIS